MTKHALLAIRANAVATAAMCDALLRALAGEPGDLGGECPHPQDLRVPAGRMGSPDAFFCRSCQQEVGG